MSHNLYTPSELAEVKAAVAGHGSSAPTPERVAPAREHANLSAAPAPDRLAELAAEVEALRAEVARLSDRIVELETRGG